MTVAISDWVARFPNHSIDAVYTQDMQSVYDELKIESITVFHFYYEPSERKMASMIVVLDDEKVDMVELILRSNFILVNRITDLRP